jgi:hypothetical protein
MRRGRPAKSIIGLQELYNLPLNPMTSFNNDLVRKLSMENTNTQHNSGSLNSQNQYTTPMYQTNPAYFQIPQTEMIPSFQPVSSLPSNHLHQLMQPIQSSQHQVQPNPQFNLQSFEPTELQTNHLQNEQFHYPNSPSIQRVSSQNSYVGTHNRLSYSSVGSATSNISSTFSPQSVFANSPWSQNNEAVPPTKPPRNRNAQSNLGNLQTNNQVNEYQNHPFMNNNAVNSKGDEFVSKMVQKFNK